MDGWTVLRSRTRPGDLLLHVRVWLVITSTIFTIHPRDDACLVRLDIIHSLPASFQSCLPAYLLYVLFLLSLLRGLSIVAGTSNYAVTPLKWCIRQLNGRTVTRTHTETSPQVYARCSCILTLASLCLVYSAVVYAMLYMLSVHLASPPACSLARS